MTNEMNSPNPYQHTGLPPVVGGQAPTGEGDNTGGLIPYKNPHALIAYYLGVFSLLPILGLLLAIPAFVLGIMGLRARNRNPAIKGSAHAWIGIVMGALMTLLWGGLIVAAFVGAMTASVSRM